MQNIRYLARSSHLIISKSNSLHELSPSLHLLPLTSLHHKPNCSTPQWTRFTRNLPASSRCQSSHHDFSPSHQPNWTSSSQWRRRFKIEEKDMCLTTRNRVLRIVGCWVSCVWRASLSILECGCWRGWGSVFRERWRYYVRWTARCVCVTGGVWTSVNRYFRIVLTTWLNINNCWWRCFVTIWLGMWGNILMC